MEGGVLYLCGFAVCGVELSVFDFLGVLFGEMLVNEVGLDGVELVVDALVEAAGFDDDVDWVVVEFCWCCGVGLDGDGFEEVVCVLDDFVEVWVEAWFVGCECEVGDVELVV